MPTGMTIQSSRDVALRAAHFCTENCTESGKSVQFQPISSVSKCLKFNRYVTILGSIPTRASSIFLIPLFCRFPAGKFSQPANREH